MALQSSGAISLLDLQNEFGGSSPISISEYYNADDGVVTSGAISMNNFYSKARRLAASYSTNIVYETIPRGAGGVGEGFYRTAAAYTNATNRAGTVRLWGNVGTWYYDGYGNKQRESKIFGARLYVDGSIVQEVGTSYFGAWEMYWDRTAYFGRSTTAYVSVYVWGNYGTDRVGGGIWAIGAV